LSHQKFENIFGYFLFRFPRQSKKQELLQYKPKIKVYKNNSIAKTKTKKLKKHSALILLYVGFIMLEKEKDGAVFPIGSIKICVS
jgi:hypothetical protein